MSQNSPKNLPIIGTVPYLNALPLITTLQEEGYPLIAQTPAQLSETFQRQEVDVALLSLFDILSMPEALIVDDIAIGCDGPVRSVFLSHKEPLEEIEFLYLDPSSHTSNKLLQILLPKKNPKNIYYLLPDEPLKKLLLKLPLLRDDPYIAQLLIGDPALQFRNRNSHLPFQFWDLGEAWKKQTDLPFVFALWCIHPQSRYRDTIPEILRNAKQKGVQNRSEIAKQHPEILEGATYLNENIHYNLGPLQKQAIELFESELHQAKLIDTKEILKKIYC